MKKTPIVLNGQPVGRVKAGWSLFKETWRFFTLDKEMIWTPLIVGVASLVFFMPVLLYFLSFALTNPVVDEPTANALAYGLLFACYLIGAFGMAIQEAVIAHIVYTRVHGGDATLRQGFARAFSHWFTLFLWSMITSTVGVVLRMISNKSKWLGRLVIYLLGAAWSILTYFVVPAMVIDNKTPFASIKKSGQVFKRTWGEVIVSNISLGLVFTLATVATVTMGGILTILLIEMDLLLLAFITVIAMIVSLIVFGLLNSTLNSILKMLLYIYATEGVVPENFNRELIEKMLHRDLNLQAMPNEEEQISSLV